MQMDDRGSGSGLAADTGIDVNVGFAPDEGAEYTWARAADGDAIPGDPDGVAEFAGALEAKATEIRDYADEIRRLDPDWSGEAANTFSELKDTLPPRMELAADRFETVAGALHNYADDLRDAQADANGARDAANGLLGDLADAKAHVDHAEDMLEGGSVEIWEEDNGQAFPYGGPDDLAAEVSRIKGLIEDHWSDFSAAFDDRWTAAETCTEAIEDTSNDTGTTGLLNDTVPDRAGEGADYARDLQDLIDDGADSDEINALLAEIGEHAEDPAFAVGFTETFGIGDSVEAIDAGADEEILGRVLDTAAGAVAPAMYEDEWIPYDVDLEDNFIHDLISDYEPDGLDQAVILADLTAGISDPPTQLVIDVADGRLTPWLVALDEGPLAPYPDLRRRWATAETYMDMLGRDQDAAADWLGRDNNLERGLTLSFSTRPDTTADGAYINDRLSDEAHRFDLALAELMGVGLTHPDAEVGEPLMREVIEHTSENVDDLFEQAGFDNPYLSEALAWGFAENADALVPSQAAWDASEDDLPRDLRQMGDFFGVVMLDNDPLVYTSLFELNSDRTREGDFSGARMLGVANHAHANGLLTLILHGSD